MVMEQSTKQQLELLAYKLLYDIFFLWILAVIFLLIAQNILPNYFFSQISLAKMIFGLFAIAFLIGFFGKRQNILIDSNQENPKKISRNFIFLLILSALLIVNSFRNLDLHFLLISSISALIVFFFFLKIIFSDQK